MNNKEQEHHGISEHQIPPGYIHWRDRETPYLEDHEYLSELSNTNLLELYSDPNKSFSLISQAMLEEEYARYNPGDTILPETKILFLIDDNLQTALNLDGSRARRKEARFAKASEHDELIASISQFIDHFPGIPASRVYSEIADVMWNLIQLTTTDSNAQADYKYLLGKFISICGLTNQQVGPLVITKYSTRLYEHQGKTNHTIEDAQIERLLFGIQDSQGELHKLLPVLSEDRASHIFNCMQKSIKPFLSSRLIQLDVFRNLNIYTENHLTPNNS